MLLTWLAQCVVSAIRRSSRLQCHWPMTYHLAAVVVVAAGPMRALLLPCPCRHLSLLLLLLLLALFRFYTVA